MSRLLSTNSRLNELNALIEIWQRVVNSYVQNESYIFEWQNDLDTRRLIDDLLAELSVKIRLKFNTQLKPLDEDFISNTFEINECVWGSKVENEHGYNRQKNWYYYRMNQNVFDREAGNFTKSDVSSNLNFIEID